MFLDFAFPGQMNFQSPSTPIMAGIIDLHHNIFFYLIWIFTLVLYLFFIIVNRGAFGWENANYKHLQTYRLNYLTLNNLAHGKMLELIWTIIPTIILMMIAIPSFSLLYGIDAVTHPEYTIKIMGHQWYWSYSYSKNLSQDSYMLPFSDLKAGELRLLEVDNSLVLPVRTPVRLIITAEDVLHSFAIPSLGVKVDAVPGRLNQAQVYVLRTGIYYGQCSEICGVNHGFMPIRLQVINKADFKSFK